jgi:hypothetical protein
MNRLRVEIQDFSEVEGFDDRVPFEETSEAMPEVEG